MGRLFWKLFFAFWLSLLLTAFAVGMAVSLHNRSLNAGDPDLSAGPRTAFMVHTAQIVVESAGRQGLLALLKQWEARGRAYIYAVDPAGRELLGRPVAPEVLAQARHQLAAGAEADNVREARTVAGERFLLFIPAAADPHLLRRRDPPSPIPLIAAGLFAGLLFSALFAWYLARPIRNLRWAFEAVTAGHLETRVAPRMGRRRDEVSDLGRDFDRMADQLQKLVGAQRRLLHDVSHELRSPLARLHAAIGLLRQDSSQLEGGLERIEREAGRVDELVGQLLTLSRLEAGSAPPRQDEIDLTEMSATIAEDARFEAEATERRLEFHAEGEVPLRVNGELIYRAIENLLRNAVKYTPPGSCVEVRAGAGAAGAFRLAVCDRGPGVPEADLGAIFEPFYRGGNGSAAPGFGLGLAIARRAVEAHGGRIVARNREGGGLCVELELPAAGEDQG